MPGCEISTAVDTRGTRALRSSRACLLHRLLTSSLHGSPNNKAFNRVFALVNFSQFDFSATLRIGDFVSSIRLQKEGFWNSNSFSKVLILLQILFFFTIRLITILYFIKVARISPFQKGFRWDIFRSTIRRRGVFDIDISYALSFVWFHSGDRRFTVELFMEKSKLAACGLMRFRGAFFEAAASYVAKNLG